MRSKRAFWFGLRARGRASCLAVSAWTALLVVSPELRPSSAAADSTVVAGAVRVDGLAAVVGGYAPGAGTISILQSDVDLRARLALLRAGAGEAALGPLPASLLRASLEELLGEALIAAESARLSLAAPAAADVQRERQRLTQSVGGVGELSAFARALGVDEAEFLAIATRKAVVSGFLTANLEGTLEIAPAELARAYAEPGHPFAGEPLEAVRDQLRAWLVQRRLEAAVARWVDSLRQRTPMRRLVTY